MPLLVRGWMVLVGQHDFPLRLLGVLIGLCLVAAFWVTAWATRRPPLLSLVLIGLNTLAIIYADSLRGYGVGSAAIVLLAGGMWSFLQKPTWRRAALLAGVALLSVQALYQNAVLVFAICLGAWLVCWRRKDFSAAVKIFLAGACAAVSLLPYWPLLAGMPQAGTILRRGFQPDVVWENIKAIIAFPLAEYAGVWLLLLAGLLVAAGLGGRRRPAETAADRVELSVFAAGTTLAALVAFTLFLWYAALLTQPWYFLPLLALLAVCFDFGLAPLLFLGRFRAVGAGLLLATALIGVMFSQRDLDWQFTNMDQLAGQVRAQADAQDFVLVTPWYCGISFERYAPAGTHWQTLPPLADHSTHRYDLVQAQMLNPHPLAPVLDQLAAALQSGHRVWIVGNLALPAPGGPMPADLPPPPLKQYGWSDLPYSQKWASQTAWFLANHTLQFERLDHATNGSVRCNEYLRLFVASGWKPLMLSTNRL